MSTAAPGSAAGYLFQLERALAWLARSGSQDRVGIETTEDVVHESAGGVSTFEQDKHSLDPEHVPFGDYSIDLWKTLSNWCTAFEQELLCNNFELHLVTNQAVAEGLAREISRASTPDEVEAVIAVVREFETESERLLRYVANVRSSEMIFSRLVPHIKLFDSSDDTAGAPAVRVLVDLLHLPDHTDGELVVQGLLGWIQEVCMAAWRAQRPAWITKQAFNNQLFRLQERQRTRGLIRAVSQIPVSDDDLDALRDKMFIQQIRLLEFDDDADEISAMNDYFRAETERSRIVDKGDVTRDEWVAFEAQLVDRWDRLARRLKRDLRRSSSSYDADALEIGRKIFDQTLHECSISLCDARVEQYFVCGQYHQLADDAATVGWHPDFRTIFKNDAQHG
jgi:hypothetical protein